MGGVKEGATWRETKTDVGWRDRRQMAGSVYITLTDPAKKKKKGRETKVVPAA